MLPVGGNQRQPQWINEPQCWVNSEWMILISNKNNFQISLNHPWSLVTLKTWDKSGDTSLLITFILTNFIHSLEIHYVAASTHCRFLPYDLITIQNWCHLYWILHYSTQFICIEPFFIHVQWGMNLQISGIRTQWPWMNSSHLWLFIHGPFSSDFWFQETLGVTNSQ